MITHYKDLPSSDDMAPYDYFYRKYVSLINGNRQDLNDLLFVELGVRYGCSARIIYEEIRFPDFLVLVDPVSNSYIQELVDSTTRITFLQFTAEETVDYFSPDSISLLHIDVDPHGYEQTKNIFQIYQNKVKEQGYIIFHDFDPEKGVYQFVNNELPDPFKIVEICQSSKECGYARPVAVIKNKVGK
jgi:hypothetical protein